MFLTVTPTLGPHRHLDCTLWYLLALTPDTPIVADPAEFDGSDWFPRRAVADWPAGRTDPHLHRFLTKVEQLTAATGPQAMLR